MHFRIRLWSSSIYWLELQLGHHWTQRVNLRWHASLYLCHLHRGFAWSRLNFISYFIVFCFCEYHLIFSHVFFPKVKAGVEKCPCYLHLISRLAASLHPWLMCLCAPGVRESSPLVARPLISSLLLWGLLGPHSCVNLSGVNRWDVLTLFLTLHGIHVTFLSKYTFA